MNRFSTLSAVAALLVASPALAQEAHDWSGLYLGAHVGNAVQGSAADSLDCPGWFVGDANPWSGFDEPSSVTVLESLTTNIPISTDALCNDPEMAYLIGGNTFLRPSTQADPELGYGYDLEYGGETGTIINSADPELGTESYLDEVTGWLGGVQVGMLQQNDNFVLGGELSASLTGISDTRDSYVGYTGVQDGDSSDIEYTGDVEYDGTASTETELSVDWMMLAQARLGLAAGNALFSLNGGLALVGTTLHNTVLGGETAEFDDDPESGCANDTCYDNIGYGGDWSESVASAGWTLGAQADLAVSEQDSMFIAYNYVSVPNVRYTGQIEAPIYDTDNSTYELSPATQTYEYDLGFSILKAGFNHKF